MNKAGLGGCDLLMVTRRALRLYWGLQWRAEGLNRNTERVEVALVMVGSWPLLPPGSVALQQ